MTPPFKVFLSLDEINYFDCIEAFFTWCKQNYLSLNVSKTKEVIFDFRHVKSPLQPVVIEEQEVEMVPRYKYLGLTIDEKLNWHEHSNTVCKKANQRLYFLRKLKSFDVCTDILAVFYTACIQSVLSFGISCWGGNLRVRDEEKLNRLIRKASKVAGCDLPSIREIYEHACKKKALNILNSPSHPLYLEFTRSCRTGRLLSRSARTDRYRKSFVPTSIRLLR